MKSLMSYVLHPLQLPRPILLFTLLVFISGLLSLIALLFLFLWVAVSRAPSTTRRSSLGRSAAVIVLGDVGRSPRMCYHVQSLADDGWRVAVLGYKGTPPPPPLRRSSIRHHHLAQPLSGTFSRLPRTGGIFAFIVAPLKVILQSASLFWELSAKVKPPPELVLVQTPPAIPTLLVARTVCLLLGSRVVIDWHNLGYTILSMRLSPSNPLVTLARTLEKASGHNAFAHLCVTDALKKHLQNDWKVKGKVSVLHDRPPPHFRKSTQEESHRLFSHLCPLLEPNLRDWFPSYDPSSTTPFTTQEAFRSDRPALVVSSTSWTVDEDFGMLLKAASIYEKRAKELIRARRSSTLEPETPSMMGGSGIESTRDRSRRASLTTQSPGARIDVASRLPKLLIIVTGKGEQRAQYEREIAIQERGWDWVRIRTAWLERDDYPTLLGSADVGVSLHTSSSGLDLPMKVVDMLGCGLPVCALGFPCLDELIHHGSNGLVFYSAEELASQLEGLLASHPETSWLSSKLNSSTSVFETSTGDFVESAVPPSPSSVYHSFSLLSSPIIPTSQLNSPNDTWTGNWKRVVRPLIAAADHEDAVASEKKLPSNAGLALWTQTGREKAGARNRGDKVLGTPPKNSLDSDRDQLGLSEGEEDGDSFRTSAKRLDDGIVLRRSPRAYLRRRRSSVRGVQDGTMIPRVLSDEIPNIHISAPTT